MFEVTYTESSKEASEYDKPLGADSDNRLFMQVRATGIKSFNRRML